MYGNCRPRGPIAISIVEISDTADPRIAPYTSIREKDLTGGHDGRFIIEGKVTLDALIHRSRFQAESLFLAQTRLAPLEALIRVLPEDLPIYTAPQAIMDTIVGFPIHRGVLACAHKGKPLDTGELLQSAKTLLVLVGLSNHDNVGACFRNAAAFGVDAVLLDAASCDPLYRKSIRVSVGAALSLPFIHGSHPDEIFDHLAGTGFETWCLTPNAEAQPLQSLSRPDRLALVLGPEGPGLERAQIARGKAVHIPMVTGFDSVNVATAGAIAMSHVFGT